MIYYEHWSLMKATLQKRYLLHRSVSPPSEDSLAPFFPWPLLLQQVAMQNSLKDLDTTSITEINSRKSSLFDPLEPSEITMFCIKKHHILIHKY